MTLNLYKEWHKLITLIDVSVNRQLHLITNHFPSYNATLNHHCATIWLVKNAVRILSFCLADVKQEIK